MVRAQLEFDVWMPLLHNILLAPGTFLDLSLDPQLPFYISEQHSGKGCVGLPKWQLFIFEDFHWTSSVLSKFRKQGRELMWSDPDAEGDSENPDKLIILLHRNIKATCNASKRLLLIFLQKIHITKEIYLQKNPPGLLIRTLAGLYF